jgi:hypothetical protein
MKKKTPIFGYFLLLFFIFVVLFSLQQMFIRQISISLFYYKFGTETISEIIWAGLVLLIVLLFKNKYIFTQEREDYFKSFKYIVPELILSGFFLLVSLLSIVTNQGKLDFTAIFNVALYCLFIGIVEEFLCRGWILNEFLERYSENRKEICLSIFFSALIFGLIHLTNVGTTASIAEVLVQVMNATAGGIFLALVYYKTKNIWIVVTSHAIWDFSLLLGDVNTLGDCVVGTPSNQMIMSNVISGLFLTVAYLCLCYWLYCQTDLYEGKEKKRGYLIIIGVGIYLFSLFFGGAPEEGYYTCPNYQFKKIDENFKASYYHYGKYTLEDEGLELYLDDDYNLVLKNRNDDQVKLITDEFYNFLLIENSDSYSIVIHKDYNVVLYNTYLKSDIQDTKEYLESVKESLETYVTTDIDEIGVLEYQNSEYKYPIIKDKQYNYLYFDIDKKLYMDK